jgi:hypothetical protein
MALPLTETDATIDQSDKIIIPLFHHQRILTRRMIDIENTPNTKLAYLSNKVGTGKSLCMLSTIASNKLSTASKRYTYLRTDQNNQFIKHKSKYITLKTNLLFIKNTILNQWLDYLTSQTTLTFHVIGAIDVKNSSDAAIISMINKSVDINVIVYDITTFASKRIFDHFVNLNINVKRIIIDEISDWMVKLKFITIGFKFFWIISSTSFNYINCDGYRHCYNFKHDGVELSFADFMKNAYLQYNVYTSDSLINSSINLPPPQIINVTIYTSRVHQLIHNVLPELSDAINKHDLLSISKHLHSDIVNPNQIIPLLINSNINLISQLYNKCCSHTQQIINEICEQHKLNNMHVSQFNINDIINHYKQYCSELRFAHVFAILTQITNLENKNKCIIDRFSEIKNQQCLICYASIQETQLNFMCNGCHNILCSECFNHYANHSGDINVKCPICRKYIGYNILSSSTPVEHAKVPIEHAVVEVTPKKYYNKVEYIKDIIKFKPSSKLLIIIQHGDFSNIKEQLTNYIIVNKSEDINSYVNGSINIAFINGVIFGDGINLQVTTDLIIFHKVPDHDYIQYVGRAQRIGRTSPLIIHNLLYENE